MVDDNAGTHEPTGEASGRDVAATDADVLDEVDAPSDVVGGSAPSDADVLDEVDVPSDVLREGPARRDDERDDRG